MSRPTITVERLRDATLRADEWVLEMTFHDERVVVACESVMGPQETHLNPVDFAKKLLRDWSSSARVMGSDRAINELRVSVGKGPLPSSVAAQEAQPNA